MAGKSFVFRFDDMEVREREFTLVKAGKVLTVEPKAFRALLFLLHNPQKLIAKEELLSSVWGDAAVTDGSLTRCIWLLRSVLEDDIRNPRYIETVATVGYRFVCKVEVAEDASGALEDSTDHAGEEQVQTAWKESAAEPPEEIERGAGGEMKNGRVEKDRRRQLLYWLLPGAVVVACLAFEFWYLRLPQPPPHISEYVRLTHDSQPKLIVGTDGNRLYLNQMEPQTLSQVPVAGGQIAPISVPVNLPFLEDISPDGSTLLVSSPNDLWSVGVLGNSPRYLTKAPTVSAVWSPDGKSVAYSTWNGEIYRARSDWSEVQKLTSATGHDKPAFFLAWAPDGETLRFTRGYQLWEISSHGSNPRKLLPDWNPSAYLCCGRWTPDGAFFLFLSGDSLLRRFLLLPGAQLWALDERSGLLRRPPAQPVQLTSGPTRWGAPIPSKDGKKIFARGVTIRGELERFDSQSREFRPFLGGISAEYVAFSNDGKSVAYVSYPEGILWKANLDGSNPVQLTDPPIYPKNIRWSPDGTQIVFFDQPARESIPETYIVPSESGKPQRLLPEAKEPMMDANWSPDGRKIVFSNCNCVDGTAADSKVIRILDLASHQVTTLPGSEGMISPRWSPDGRFIAVLSYVGYNPRVYDFETKQWAELLVGPVDWPTWSKDSRSIYFLRSLKEHGVIRVSIQTGKIERVADLKGFQNAGWIGLWMGLDPTDAPLFLRNVGSEDIYALTLDRK